MQKERNLKKGVKDTAEKERNNRKGIEVEKVKRKIDTGRNEERNEQVKMLTPL
jgi:hypothetical protein